MKRFLCLATILILLIACTPTTETAVTPPPTSAPETAVLPTNTAPPPAVTVETPRVEPPTTIPETDSSDSEEVTETATSAPEPTAEVVAEASIVSGRTEEGAFFLGDPNAPITHIDYSDFL